MAISKTHSKKAPNQNPVAFYKSEQFGGAEGKSTQKVGDKLSGGPQREKVMGRKDLAKQ
jgi:hypothetical protein